MANLAALLDLILPTRCVGCARAGAALCAGCMPAGPLVPVAAAHLPTVAAASYDAAVRAALLAFKERGRRDLAAPLARLLGRAVLGVLGDRSPPGTVVLVPVPSSRAAAAARGGDHVVRLARRAGCATGIRPATGVLTLTRAVRDSAGLTVSERAANLAGSMSARRAPPGWSAVLVDDIVTTGATLAEAGRALVASGWPVLGAGVVAATARQFEPPRAPIGRPSGSGLA